jgi:hypothetical protein
MIDFVVETILKRECCKLDATARKPAEKMRVGRLNSVMM